jgi:hypothetical protein
MIFFCVRCWVQIVVVAFSMPPFRTVAKNGALYFVFYVFCIKVVCHEIFDLRFFHEMAPTGHGGTDLLKKPVAENLTSDFL